MPLPVVPLSATLSKLTSPAMLSIKMPWLPLPPKCGARHVDKSAGRVLDDEIVPVVRRQRAAEQYVCISPIDNQPVIWHAGDQHVAQRDRTRTGDEPNSVAARRVDRHIVHHHVMYANSDNAGTGGVVDRKAGELAVRCQGDAVARRMSRAPEDFHLSGREATRCCPVRAQQ